MNKVFQRFNFQKVLKILSFMSRQPVIFQITMINLKNSLINCFKTLNLNAI